MQKQQLSVTTRGGLGKGAARRIRREGEIPAVLYGLGSSTPVSVNRKELVSILNTGAGSSSLLSIKLDGTGEEKLAIIRDFQMDQVKNQVIHADFLEVATDKPIHVTVTIVLSEDEIRGVKEGGMLQQPMRELAVECLPLNIPEHIVVDASNLGVGETLHLADVKLPEGVKTAVEPDHVVVTIAAPVSEEKLDEMLSAEAEAEVKEPEIIAREKEEGA